MKHCFVLLFVLGFYFNSLSQTPITIREGASIKINLGTSLTNSELTLKSVSNQYSNLIVDGSLGTSPDGVVNYDRYINLIGSDSAGGNDLVSFPVFQSGDNFDDFLAYGESLNDNKLRIASNPSNSTEYLFGPYENKVPTGYVNYNEGNSDIIEVGKGYRAATTDIDLDLSGETVRFTGNVIQNDVLVTIDTEDNTWNAVGNPYPSYIDAQLFLDENIAALAANSTLNPDAAAIYAYNDATDAGSNTIGNFTIINKTSNTNINIAPGQGFLVSDNALNNQQLSFTQSMRTFEGTDDFILGRSSGDNFNIRLFAQTESRTYATEFYFNNQASDGLDIGYDAELYIGQLAPLMIYSHLVEDNSGKRMAIQAIDNNFDDVTIPLGLKASQGQQVTIGIKNSDLPDDVQVYLEDNFYNTFTPLNNSSYTFTTENNLNGTGRFFLRTTNETLSEIGQYKSSLNMYAIDKIVYIKGQLSKNSQLKIMDIQGRNVLSTLLDYSSTNNQVDVSNLTSGIYILGLLNDGQEKAQKIIIK